MDYALKGMHALVAGGATGIGFAVAQASSPKARM